MQCQTTIGDQGRKFYLIALKSFGTPTEKEILIMQNLFFVLMIDDFDEES